MQFLDPVICGAIILTIGIGGLLGAKRHRRDQRQVDADGHRESPKRKKRDRYSYAVEEKAVRLGRYFRLTHKRVTWVPATKSGIKAFITRYSDRMAKARVAI